MASSDGDHDRDELIRELEELERTVDEPHEQAHVRETISLARRLPGSKRISKYTTRDVAETFVGGVLFSLPLLVEGGVFEIARHFATYRVGGIPLFFLANIIFIITMTIGLIYGADIREVTPERLLFGIIPRRLLGVLLTSLIVATMMMLLWGRLFEGDPTTLEAAARVSVIWAAAAFGGSLGDILPGESRGHDIVIKNLDEIVRRDE